MGPLPCFPFFTHSPLPRALSSHHRNGLPVIVFFLPARLCDPDAGVSPASRSLLGKRGFWIFTRRSSCWSSSASRRTVKECSGWTDSSRCQPLFTHAPLAAPPGEVEPPGCWDGARSCDDGRQETGHIPSLFLSTSGSSSGYFREGGASVLLFVFPDVSNPPCLHSHLHFASYTQLEPRTRSRYLPVLPTNTNSSYPLPLPSGYLPLALTPVVRSSSKMVVSLPRTPCHLIAPSTPAVSLMTSRPLIHNINNTTDESTHPYFSIHRGGGGRAQGRTLI
ncbi:hypothetical protein B0T11DRAFT_53879 [Plectosphaerella cucumerina]|uniref:Uncharacterized protein n=1 Tax=Plectosphaerella cucumerina TaxID=40658 RepID=A0A8K0X546_9PEZI|nr:hypothetical protein B0T11DRAFT_53879 [Plectosphaerella cucumerina]